MAPMKLFFLALCLDNLSLKSHNFAFEDTTCLNDYFISPSLLQMRLNEAGLLVNGTDNDRTKSTCGGFQRTRFARSRVLYYSNGYATFNYELLRLCGDIIPTPGPTNEHYCPVCNRSVAKNHRAVSCDSCTRWCHIKCGGISVKQYKEFDARQSFSWVCPPCLDILQQLPFANASLVDSSLSSENSFSSGDDTIFLPGYQKLALEHAKNFKIGHINANSIGGLKFEEIRHWLELNYFDLLVITETKLNSTFPDSQFQVHGFRLLRNDRNRCGGGVAMFIRSNIPFMRAKRLESFIDIECVAVRLKLSNSWTTFVGLYRPPSLDKSTWKLEMCNLFETVTEMSKDVFILGDFNCDMLNPNKPPNQGRDLMDIMDIFAFENLISGATRITDNSQTLLDLVLTNSKLRVLQAGV